MGRGCGLVITVLLLNTDDHNFESC